MLVELDEYKRRAGAFSMVRRPVVPSVSALVLPWAFLQEGLAVLQEALVVRVSAYAGMS